MTTSEDQFETRRLADRYCSAVDDGDAEVMASLFVPGGRLAVYRPGDAPGTVRPVSATPHAVDSLLASRPR